MGKNYALLGSGGAMSKVKIFVKDGCPYCTAALEDLQTRGVEFQQLNVKSDSKVAAEALKYSKGERTVPIIVQVDGSVRVGFNGG
jgi:glutaredoxin 3